jgi:hypothetical protein
MCTKPRPTENANSVSSIVVSQSAHWPPPSMRTLPSSSHSTWKAPRLAPSGDLVWRRGSHPRTTSIRAGHAAVPVTPSFVRAQAIARSRGGSPSNGRFASANQAATPGRPHQRGVSSFASPNERGMTPACQTLPGLARACAARVDVQSDGHKLAITAFVITAHRSDESNAAVLATRSPLTGSNSARTKSCAATTVRG